MIFINHSADYSDLGIGKAPIIKEETREILSGFTGLDEDKLFFFQTFLEEIGGTDGGIWSAIERLYIPMYANGVLKDAFFDVKNGAISYLAPSIVNNDNVANYYELTAKGVKIPASVTDASAYILKNGENKNIQKSKENILFFAVSEYPNAGGRNIWGKTDCGTNSQATSLKCAGYEMDVIQTTNALNTDCVYVISSKDNNGYAYLKSETSKDGIRTTSMSSPGYTAIMIGASNQVSDFTSKKWPAGLKIYGFGRGLNNEDAATFADALVKFNNSFNE